MDELVRLAELIRNRNAIAAEIAGLIDRPAQIGHVGEYIASRIFGIALNESAAHKSIDGFFTEGGLSGRSVNIKWYAKREGLLNLTADAAPDYYLVMTGPKEAAMSSRGTTRPWVIAAVFLFDAHRLTDTLRGHGIKIGVASSVRAAFWDEAEIYPSPCNTLLTLSDEQRRILALFR